jgi:hypothetical protein
VLNVYLSTLESQFDLDITCLLANPQEHLITIVEDHDIIVSQIILTEVRTLL